MKPNEKLDYDTDFSQWLTGSDTIANVTSTLVNNKTETSTLAIDTTTWTSDTVKIWLALGSDGDSQRLEIKITTAEGRIKEVCHEVRVKGC